MYDDRSEMLLVRSYETYKVSKLNDKVPDKYYPVMGLLLWTATYADYKCGFYY